MKILLTGGTGVISRAVAVEALSQGMDVYIMNRGNHLDRLPAGVTHLKCDIRNEQQVVISLRDLFFDVVVDFLCFTPDDIKRSVSLFKDRCSQFLFVSTACVYNASVGGVFNEDSPKAFKKWKYSVNKWAAEQYLVELAKEYPCLSYNIIRPGLTYDDTRIPYGLVPDYGFHWTLVERIKNHKPIITWNHGMNKWSMMRVEDFAIGVVGLFGKEGIRGMAFNVSGDNPYTWLDVLNVLSEYVGEELITYDINSEELYQYLRYEKGDEIYGRSVDYVVSNKRIKDVIPEFSDHHTLKEGITKTLQSYQEQNFQKGIDYAFDGIMDAIIAYDSKKRGLKEPKRNLKFIDYLGDASFKTRILYNKKRYRYSKLIQILKRIYYIIHI